MAIGSLSFASLLCTHPNFRFHARVIVPKNSRNRPNFRYASLLLTKIAG